MIDERVFDERPIIVAIAGPNGTGKTTFYRAHLEPAGLPWVNADVLSRELGLDPYPAASVADALRRALVARSESFIFETVFSDPVGGKIDFLEEAMAAGYTVALCFIGIDGPEVSIERVSMRVSKGGHDVPDEKLRSRFPRILANLERAIRRLPTVFVYDNSDMGDPFRRVAMFRDGRREESAHPVPGWLHPLLR
jgi:predicted ABC-type ATPase